MRKLVLLTLLAASGARAQEISVKTVELDGEKVIVTYLLQDTNPGNTYQLRLYCSRDNFSAPLTKVTGDVGDEVKTGDSRKMVWNIKDEFGPFKGDIALEIRGKVFVPFVRFNNMETGKRYKRGGNMIVDWKAGGTNPLNIELQKGGARVAMEANQPNSGSYTMRIPSNAKPGKDYRLKMTDTRTNDVIYSPLFAIIPKIPLLLKVVPVALVGGVAAAAAGGGSTSSNGSIPDPPAVPTN